MRVKFVEIAVDLSDDALDEELLDELTQVLELGDAEQSGVGGRAVVEARAERVGEVDLEVGVERQRRARQVMRCRCRRGRE